MRNRSRDGFPDHLSLSSVIWFHVGSLASTKELFNMITTATIEQVVWQDEEKAFILLMITRDMIYEQYNTVMN